MTNRWIFEGGPNISRQGWVLINNEESSQTYIYNTKSNNPITSYTYPNNAQYTAAISIQNGNQNTYYSN